MSRAVRDDIVITKCAEAGVDSIYIDNLTRYSADVNEQIKKVRLEQSTYGLANISIVDELKRKYESIKITAGECYLLIANKRMEATSEQIRMLKALAMEQVSFNMDYSLVVKHIFVTLFQQIALNQVTCNFMDEENEDIWSIMQKEVLLAFSEYIKKILMDKKDVVN